MDLRTLADRLVLALTVWGEARGEPVEGQIAVANVVRNRLHRATNAAPRWRDVCLAPSQFSCFNAYDPNYVKVLAAAAQMSADRPTADMRQALWIADGVMADSVADNTRAATHYLTSWLFRTTPPTWAKDAPVLTTIGHHVFLRVA